MLLTGRAEGNKAYFFTFLFVYLHLQGNCTSPEVSLNKGLCCMLRGRLQRNLSAVSHISTTQL